MRTYNTFARKFAVLTHYGFVRQVDGLSLIECLKLNIDDFPTEYVKSEVARINDLMRENWVCFEWTVKDNYTDKFRILSSLQWVKSPELFIHNTYLIIESDL